jgi:5'-3' exonuclease
MGIPYLFASLAKRYSIVKQKASANYFAIDMNCLIHHYLTPESPLESVMAGLKQILLEIPARDTFIAFDGLVPYGKMVQQRYRRFRICQEEFDKRQISPDTPYMRSLESKIKEEFPEIRISPTQEPGEGEHKIFLDMNICRPEKVIIYGLDADLILLSLQRSEQIFLMRDGFLDVGELKSKLPISAPEFLRLSLFFGNDFMPSLGMFSLREDGYERALKLFQDSGATLMTPEGRQTFLDFCADRETECLKKIIKKRNLLSETWIADGSEFSRKYYLHVLDGVLNTQPVSDAYWKSYHWTLDYFLTNTPPNWDWYYPYADAPLIQDLGSEVMYEKGELTYKIKDQLQFILPSSTLKKINRRQKFQDEWYTETREPWLKRYDWEMRPRISLPINQTEIRILKLQI